MPKATGRDLYVDQVLTNVALGYRPEGMIADLLFPKVLVPKQSSFYSIFSRADILRIEDDKRAPGTEANKIVRSISSGTYFANNYALDSEVYIEDKANMDPLFLQKLYNGRTTFLMDKLMIGWESRIANLVNNTSNVGSSSAVSSSWMDSENSDAFGDVNTALDNVQDTTGIRPNRLAMGLTSWRLLRRNTGVINKIFGNNNGGGLPSKAMIADLFEVEQILVGASYKNTANEAQAENLTNIWAPNVLAYYAPSNPTIDRPSFGYSFRWVQPGLANMVVERHPYDTRKKKEDIEAGYYQDEKIVGPDYGFLITAVNSST